MATVDFEGSAQLETGDRNGDGYDDIMLHFATQDVNLTPEDTEASVTGKAGIYPNQFIFIGTETVNVIK